MTTQGSTWKRNTITADQMASLIALVMKKEVTGSAAKRILSIMFSGSRQSPNQIADDKGLILRPLSLQEYEILAEAVVTSNKAVVEAVKARGNKGKFMFLVGQMIKTGEEGSVEPQKAEAALRRIIGI